MAARFTVLCVLALALAGCGGSETPGAVARTAERSYDKSNRDVVAADRAAARDAQAAKVRGEAAAGGSDAEAKDRQAATK